MSAHHCTILKRDMVRQGIGEVGRQTVVAGESTVVWGSRSKDDVLAQLSAVPLNQLWRKRDDISGTHVVTASLAIFTVAWTSVVVSTLMIHLQRCKTYGRLRRVPLQLYRQA